MYENDVLKPFYRVDDGTESGENVNVAPGNQIHSYQATAASETPMFTVVNSAYHDATPGDWDTYADTGARRCGLRMERDIYLERLELDTSYPGDIEIQTNGYRLFVRDAIVLTGNLYNVGQKHIYFINRGENASNGVDGTDGFEGTTPAAGGAGGSGGHGGQSGTLLGGHDGKDGRDGGRGGYSTYIYDPMIEFTSYNAGDGIQGESGDAAESGITLHGNDAGHGGNGEQGYPGTSTTGNVNQGGAGGAATQNASGGAASEGETRMQHCDPHLVTTFRDVYGTADSPKSIAACAGAGSGASGGGGGHVYGSASNNSVVTLGGGGGAGGGGAGGAGGTVMICA